MENLTIIQIKDDFFVEVINHPEHIFLLPGKEVAKGYNVSSENIRKHKSENSDEFEEGKHFVVRNPHNKSGSATNIFWTLRGIMRLGFMIKSENAKLFRDWAEDMLFDYATGRITTRASVIKQKLDFEKQKKALEAQLKENDTFVEIQILETKIKQCTKQLIGLDHSVRQNIQIQFEQNEIKP